MTVVVLGAGGLLGSAMVRACLEQSRDVVGTYHSDRPSFDVPLVQHDVRDTDEFADLLTDWDATAVVNCAAKTDVDGCENDVDAAFAVNGAAPGSIASACADSDVPFVHLSTDYVFGGEATEPYSESANPDPVQVYGRSKLEGERRVMASAAASVVVRLSFVYGVRGDTDELVGFPAWVRDTLDAGEDVPLFVDQHVTPSRADQAATTLLELLDGNCTGLFHVASRSCVTPYAFGEAIAAIQGTDESLLRESAQDDVSRAAERPSYTCLDVGAVEDQLERPQPTLSEDLRAIEHCF